VTITRCAQSRRRPDVRPLIQLTQKQTLEGVKLKINSPDFRVPPGKKVDLHQWPTVVEPFFKSKEEYKTILAPGQGYLDHPVIYSVLRWPGRSCEHDALHG
jgi:hypothetical protein